MMALSPQYALEANNVSVVAKYEQCCICSAFYEHTRPIPQPDLNRMIVRLLDVVPEPNYYRCYLALCGKCINQLREFDRLRVELEFVKAQVVTQVIDTLTQVQSDGASQLSGLKSQILQRWTATNANNVNQRTPKEGFTASDTSGHSGDLSWAVQNNIAKNSVIGNEHTLDTTSAGTTSGNELIVGLSTVVQTSASHESEEEGQHCNTNVNETVYDGVVDSVDDNYEAASPGDPKSQENNGVKGNLVPAEINTTDCTSHREKKMKKTIKPRRKELIPLVCTICGRIYDRTDQFRAHTQACTTDDKMMDKICGICTETSTEPFTFETWEEFKEHIHLLHPMVKVEQCVYCCLRFLPNGLQTHKCITFKGSVASEPIFKCDLCSKEYHSRANLTDHVRRSHKDQKHKCDICGKTYGSPMLLQMHISGHKRCVSKFHCTQCGICFSSNYMLKLHTKGHTGELPYECKICGKKFALKSTLNSHGMVHSSLKPHECHLCGEKFKLKGTLRRHISRHSVKETNYTKKCVLCPKLVFRKVWVLKKHMEMKHPSTPELEEVLMKYKDVDDMPEDGKVTTWHKHGMGRNRWLKKELKKVEADEDESDGESPRYSSGTEAHTIPKNEGPQSSQLPRQSARLMGKASNTSQA